MHVLLHFKVNPRFFSSSVIISLMLFFIAAVVSKQVLTSKRFQNALLFFIDRGHLTCHHRGQRRLAV